MKCLFLALVIVISWPGNVRGQVGAANVGGTVLDESGAALPGVTMTVTNTSNGFVQTFVTGDRGNYRAVALQPAPYEIRAELTGFAGGRRTLEKSNR